MPKCKWCKEQGEKESMTCYEKPTGKFNKNGSEKMSRSYYHESCNELKLEDDKFKQQEAQDLDRLYNHLKRTHNLEVLDGRMFEKIQDLRNGTIKAGNKKFKRYKEGVSYKHMLDTYIYLDSRIDEIIHNMQFETKWNEFSYIFGTMVNNLNETKQIEIRKEQAERRLEANNSVDFDLEVVKKKPKKDMNNLMEFM